LPEETGREDPLWPRASAWLADTAAGRDPTAPLLALLGIPLSTTSISASGAHATPGAVRAALRRFAPYDAEHDVDLQTVTAVDLGDVPLAGLAAEPALELVATALAEVGLDGRLPRAPDLVVLLGGDNALTRPALDGFAPDLGSAGLLTLDAHHDVRGFHDGPTNGTPVRGLLEDGLDARNVVQVGIGAFTNSLAYRRWCEERGITAVSVADARAEGVGRCVQRHLDALAVRCDVVYVDLDVDVLDRVFAPGCPGSRPGGLAPWELAQAAHLAGAHPSVGIIDIVEVDATADPQGVTVDAAALCLLSAASGLARRRLPEAGKAGPAPPQETAH
jgi:formiminoglutamase